MLYLLKQTKMSLPVCWHNENEPTFQWFGLSCVSMQTDSPYTEHLCIFIQNCVSSQKNAKIPSSRTCPSCSAVLHLWRETWRGAENQMEAKLTYWQLMVTKGRQTSMTWTDDIVYWQINHFLFSELLSPTLEDTSVTAKQLGSWPWWIQVTSNFNNVHKQTAPGPG